MFQIEIKNECNQEKLNSIKHSFDQIINDPKYGFYKLIENKDHLNKTFNIYEKFKTKKNFYHIGIGGSSLGPSMLISALQKNDTNFYFINNIDSDEITSQLNNINIENSIFYFVSKSGGTAETLASLAIISNILKTKFNVQENDLNKYFVFCTDPENGDLKSLSKDLEVETLEVPQNIGGRFSILTHVGLFPALFAGIDINLLWQGASEFKNNPKLLANLFETADYITNLKTKGITQTVMMPYSSKLKEFSSWFVQLWAESLGKKHDLDGNIVNTGLTPIPGYGATDQHSQMQLFMEGPYDKLMILIEIENFKNDFSLTSDFKGKSFMRLNQKSLSELYKAELHGTMKALKEAKRPFINLKISKLDENTLSQLIMFCQSLTALTGKMINVDPFDQPGVEAGKIFAYQFLEESI